jgi:hypothetical protein
MNRAILECFHPRNIVIVRGDKNNWECAAPSLQLSLELQTAHSRQPLIQDQTPDFVVTTRRNEIFG